MGRSDGPQVGSLSSTVPRTNFFSWATRVAAQSRPREWKTCGAAWRWYSMSTSAVLEVSSSQPPLAFAGLNTRADLDDVRPIFFKDQSCGSCGAAAARVAGYWRVRYCGAVSHTHCDGGCGEKSL